MPPQLSSEKKLETFLIDLAIEHDVSASTQNKPLGRLGDGLGRRLGRVKFQNHQ
jgi:hypothetical protein